MGVGVHHGVTFNFFSAKVCSPAIFETFIVFTNGVWMGGWRQKVCPGCILGGVGVQRHGVTLI